MSRYEFSCINKLMLNINFSIIIILIFADRRANYILGFDRLFIYKLVGICYDDFDRQYSKAECFFCSNMLTTDTDKS